MGEAHPDPEGGEAGGDGEGRERRLADLDRLPERPDVPDQQLAALAEGGQGHCDRGQGDHQLQAGAGQQPDLYNRGDLQAEQIGQDMGRAAALVGEQAAEVVDQPQDQPGGRRQQAQPEHLARDQRGQGGVAQQHGADGGDGGRGDQQRDQGAGGRPRLIGRSLGRLWAEADQQQQGCGGIGQGDGAIGGDGRCDAGPDHVVQPLQE